MTTYSDADYQAAAAARNADEVPSVVLKSVSLGHCQDCDTMFEYGKPNGGIQNLSPCPECGSENWMKWGYRTPDGENVPIDEVNTDNDRGTEGEK